MRRLHKFRQLSWADRSLLAQALLLVVAVRLGLWLLPFQTVRRWLQRIAPANTTDQTGDPHLIRQVAWAVRVTSRYVPAATCLTQALATRILLSRRNQPSTLRIGVAKNAQGRLMAHAWIEIQGQIIIGNLPNLTDFTPLPALEMARL